MSRPLHAVFAELLGEDAVRQVYAADPAAFLAASGHSDLPAELVAEAVVSYSDVAAPEVAEHLAPFLQANTAAGTPEEGSLDAAADMDGLALIASAPAGVTVEEPAASLDDAAPGDATPWEPAPAVAGLAFGTGSDESAAGDPSTLDELTDIPTAGDEAPSAEPIMGDDALLGPDPVLAVDDPGDDEPDLDTSE